MIAALRKCFVWAGWLRPRAIDLTHPVPILPPMLWRVEWDALVARFHAAGLTVRDTDFARVSWYVCDDIPVWIMNAARPRNTPRYPSTFRLYGVWMATDRSISLTRETLRQTQDGDLDLLRHEMTHAISGGTAAHDTATHDSPWFRPEFGNDIGAQPL